MPSKVIVRRVESISDDVKYLLERVNYAELIKKNVDVFIKLNLSSVNPETMKCANTNIDVLDAMIAVIKMRTNNIYLCESDGMRYSASEPFTLGRYDKLIEKHGIKFVNFSSEEQVYGLHPLLEDFGLPKSLLRKDKVFITMPLIKTHANTSFTGALKNQWGVVPRGDRILLHKNLHKLIAIVNKLVNPTFSIMGGPWAMEGRGPTNGKPRKYPVLMASRDCVALDATAMRLIGLDPLMARHIVHSMEEGLGVLDEKEIDIEGPYEQLKTKFEPAVFDWALRMMDYCTRYKFFTHNILMNSNIFKAARKIVQAGRAVGVVR